METGISTIPGYRANEYMLALYPHEDLSNKIIKVKEEFSTIYKTDIGRSSKPHITIVTFTQFEMMEERILNRLRNVAMAQFPFKVELKNFGSFPSHTIYINVTSKVPLQGLVKEVRTDMQRMMKMDDENKPHFIMEPHIKIGLKLKPWQYEKGWLEYSQKAFTGRFIADCMVLLKRQVGEMKYHLAGKFQFQNLPIKTRQGELFG